MHYACVCVHKAAWTDSIERNRAYGKSNEKDNMSRTKTNPLAIR